MSRKMLAVAAFALVALPLTAAQSQIGFGIAAGASSPSGTSTVDMGYHVMGLVSFMPPLAPLGFRVDGMFNEFNGKSPSTTKSRIMAVTGNAVFGVPGFIVLSPYLIGGIGMYNQTFSPKPIGFTSSNDLGYNLGGGVKFGLAGFSAFGEIRYHQISSGGAKFIPITFGVIF